MALTQGGNNYTFLLYTLWCFQVLNPRLFRQFEEDIKTNETTDTHALQVNNLEQSVIITLLAGATFKTINQQVKL